MEEELAEKHTPLSEPEDLTCLATWEDISIEAGNYCEYRTMPSRTWHSSKYSSTVVQKLLETSFETYLKKVEDATKDCAASVRRLIGNGPPIYISDKAALPLPEGDTYIDMIWFSEENIRVPATLKGALIGDERQKLWNVQKEVLKAMEEAEEQQDS